MKLLELELRDFKRFTGQARVLAFDPKAQVLFGSNEAGKSTIFEAVRRVLFDKSKTGAKWVDRLTPYGTKAVPFVRLDFEHQGRRLRIEKGFGSKGWATLSERRADRDWATLANNEDAEAILLGLLGAEASGSREGAAPSNWGAFQWLFVPQHLRELPEADAATYLGLEAAGVSEQFEALLALVQAEFGRAFTATGKAALHSPLNEVTKHLEELERQRDALQQAVNSLEDLRRSHDEKQEQLPVVLADGALAKSEWEEAQAEADGLSVAKGAFEAAAEALKGASDRQRSTATVAKDRLHLEGALLTARQTRAQSSRLETEALVLFNTLVGQWTEAREKAGQLGNDVAKLRAKNLDAERCLSIRNALRELESLGQVLKRAQEADARVLAAQSRLLADPPKAALVDKAQELENEIKVKRGAAQGAGLTVQVEGRMGLRVLTDGVEFEGANGFALESVVLQAPGGAVTVRGDTAQAQRLAAEAKDRQLDLEKLLAPFGVATVADLRALRERAQEVKHAFDSAVKERKAVSEKTTAEIEAEMASRQAEADEARGKRLEATPDGAHDALSDDDLRGLLRNLVGQVKQAEAEFEAARKRRDQLDQQHKEQGQARDQAVLATAGAQASENASEAALDRHRDQHGPSQQCHELLVQAEAALKEARIRESSARETLDRISNHAILRREAAQQKYDRTRGAAVLLETQIRQLADTLDREAVKGAWSSLGQVERTIEMERARQQQLELDGSAVKLLRDTLAGVRTEVVQRVVAPIKGDLDQLIATATAGRYTLAGLDDALKPGVLSGATGTYCEFDDGSQGLRELVATLIRLAVARHLSKTEPQVLILDDPCVHVSRHRTQRLVELLNDLTTNHPVQVLVLTHRQAEFSGLAGTQVDVEAV